MGILKGDVDILGLGNLLQLLSFNRREGTLTLYKEMERKAIHFGPRGIRLLSSTMKRINRVGRILLRKRRISRADLEALLRRQKLEGLKLGQLAIRAGKATRKDVEEALREQIEEEIFDMFMWEGAAFEFQEGPSARAEATDPLAGLSFDVNVTSLLMEAARRHDELMRIRSILHDEDMVLQRAATSIPVSALGEDLEAARGLFPLVDGKRTLREVAQISPYPRFATMRAIYRLLALGQLKARDRKGAAILVAGASERAG
ncbi:MAG TPA: DUF4388 domain-containing protein [Planctomycetota bacterium]|jgi:hypothetical protein|nr:DUF4388 domain-containing protein [Planctomycetota bacterium]